MLSACVEGPEGATGATGATGDTGATGVAGADGADANSTCVDCHDDDTQIKSRQLQWEASTHAMGGNFERVESNGDTECATCHTHEGFTERMSTGLWETAAVVTNPTPPNCRTCHAIHDTYTEADFAISHTTAFDLRLDGTTVDFGDGTLCAQCHQPRLPDPLPVVGGPDVTITSAYWSLHYGAQGAMLAGTGGYEFPETGNFTYDGAHFHGDVAVNENGCPTCHMATPYGVQAGGHTMFLSYSYHGSDQPITAGCETCHASADGWSDFDYGSVQTDTKALLATLKTRLVTDLLLDAGDHVVPKTMTADQAGAVMNYLFVLKEWSDGVHNPDYAEALLENTLAATW
jgi:hypothetical protein